MVMGKHSLQNAAID